MVNKIQPVSAGLFPTLPARKGFSFTNCLKDWEGNLPDPLLREGLVQKKPKSKSDRVGSDELFVWLVHGIVQTHHTQFFASTFAFYFQVEHQFLLFQSELPLFPIRDINFHLNSVFMPGLLPYPQDLKFLFAAEGWLSLQTSWPLKSFMSKLLLPHFI